MPFEKGHSGNPVGRKAGIPNAVNRDLREHIQVLLEGHFDQVTADLASLEPKDRIDAWLKLAEFVMPKQRELSGRVKKEQDQVPYTLPDGTVIKI